MAGRKVAAKLQKQEEPKILPEGWFFDREQEVGYRAINFAAGLKTLSFPTEAEAIRAALEMQRGAEEGLLGMARKSATIDRAQVTALAGQQSLFDYSALDAETRIVVQQRAGEIKTIVKRIAADIVEVGGKLAEVKDRLGRHDRFLAWLEAEFKWSERTAYNYIAVWQKFAGADFALENIAASALHLLAAPSTPETAVEAVKAIVREGGEVSHQVAKAIVEEAKTAEKAKTPVLFEEPAQEPESPMEEPPVIAEQDEATEPETADAPAAEPVSAKSAPAKPGAAKLDAKSKEIEAAWRKATVTLSFQYLPATAASGPRKVVVTMQANGINSTFVSKVKLEEDVMVLGPVLEMIEQFKEKLPAQLAKQASAEKAVKDSKKAKLVKKGGKK